MVKQNMIFPVCVILSADGDVEKDPKWAPTDPQGARSNILSQDIYMSNRQNSRILGYVLAGHWFSENAKNWG